MSRNLLSKFIKPSGKVAKSLILASIFLLTVAGIAGYLQPITDYLSQDKYSITIGSAKITIYKIIETIFVTISIFWVSAIAADYGEKKIQSIRNVRGSTKSLIIKVFQISLYLLAALITLEVLGIDLKTLTVLSGAIGIGVGFGLQKIAANFISGLILLLEKSIEVNDVVELPDGEMGNVKRTTARYTLVEAHDGKEVMIPNENFIVNQVVNWTHSNHKARVEIKFGVDYDSDLEKVMEIALKVVKAHPKCIKDPSPSVFLTTFGSSSIDFLLYFWVSDIADGRLQPKSEVMLELWKQFKANNIVIPYPHQVVANRKEK